jgi:hypothetical protein
MTLLDSVIASVREYMRHLRVSVINNDIEVEYTMMSYDYIDADLDFDEEYYSGICSSFKRWLEASARDMVLNNEAQKITLIQNHMVFRDTDVHKETVTIIKCEDHISTTRETRVKL